MGAALVGFVASGCASAPEWPAWAMNPASESGLAAADCTPSSGDVGIDRQQVAANARTLIAQQIEVKLKAVDKVYLKKVSEKKAVASTKTFESVSEQVSEQTLRGAKIARLETYKGRAGEQLCALVVVPKDVTKQVFERAIQLTGVEVKDADRDDLYSMFASPAPVRDGN
jgi:hypothetical protein